MSEDLVFYTNPRSRGRIVRWMLEEVGQPYRTEIIDYAEIKSPAYLAVNPMGKVPSLKHGETVVTECAAICAYLADAFPAARLAPPLDDHRRATYYRWLFFAAGPIEQAVTNRALGFEAPKEREMMVGYGAYSTLLEVMEKAVSAGEYLLGDQFTAADVYFGSQVGWGMRFGGVERRGVFETYWDRLSRRPAYVRANEIDGPMA